MIIVLAATFYNVNITFSSIIDGHKNKKYVKQLLVYLH